MKDGGTDAGWVPAKGAGCKAQGEIEALKCAQLLSGQYGGASLCNLVTALGPGTRSLPAFRLCHGYSLLFPNQLGSKPGELE